MVRHEKCWKILKNIPKGKFFRLIIVCIIKNIKNKAIRKKNFHNRTLNKNNLMFSTFSGCWHELYSRIHYTKHAQPFPGCITTVHK